MNQSVRNVFYAMVELYSPDTLRIQHFTKVYTYASYIGNMENLDDKTQEILEIAAVVHDIGIHVCEEKYGHCSGDLQEKEDHLKN